ncbi:hypothetical protein ADUPG1_013544 [Aduncisulcus paluster]|uniref:Sm protein B n=1 Tax=Aduncisulcus paluster TaxID=2918883 RepID=A0ABQ5K3C7_9EUKA|nr:hypothetical protein ADUPG1_013544 [Aduncisulcus paluster]
MSHKFDRYLNHMVRVYGDDGREYYGQLIGFDIYQNLALSATDEFRKVKRTGEIEKRHLGLILIGFDIYQNLALSATDEFRKVKRTGEIEKRHLGLIVLRGKTISQIQIAGPATKQLLIKHRLAAAASAAKRAATVLDKHPPAPPSAPQTGLPVSGSGLPK